MEKPNHADRKIRQMDLNVWAQAKAAAALTRITLTKWLIEAILEKIERG